MKRTRYWLAATITAISFGVAILPSKPALAISPTPITQFAACDPGNFFTFPTWYACLPKDADGHPKLTKLEDVWLVAFPLLESAIKAAGYVAMVMVIWGCILFIKSQGNPSNITAARDTIRDAAIGLIICLSSVAIVQFLATRI
jgi:hypothetical protein